jgi:hypothetical protein
MKSRFLVIGSVVAALLLVGCPDNGFPERRVPKGSPTTKPAQPAPQKSAENEKAPQAKGAAADYARNLSNTEKKAAEVSGLETLNKAVQQYQVIEGRFPRTLDELVASRYLPKLPPAPRGKRFVYDSKAGEVTVQNLPAAKPAETAPATEAAPAATPAAESAPAQPPVPVPAPAAETPSEPAK